VSIAQQGTKTDQLMKEQNRNWKEVVENDLNMLGHRNWILVVDKAFPEQSTPGMKYLYIEQELLPTMEYLLQLLDQSTHIRPVIYRDQELEFITESQVKGIAAFKAAARQVLGDRPIETLLHEDVFSLLDESAELFKVLVIKTNTVLPYTSFFLQLDCAYWGPEQETILREKMKRELKARE